MTCISQGLEGLIGLDRRGVDIRPTLLRVLTDQFLQSCTHTPDEVRQYTELALRLLDETDMATRAAVATRLAPHPAAPRPILLQLARDVLLVAEPILLQAPCLTQQDFEAIIAERGACYADIIARREKPEPLAGAGPETPVGPPPVIPWTNAQELSELFFTADSSERRLILQNLDYVDTPVRSPPTAARDDIWRLETAALQHNAEGAIRELERGLGISNALARRMVEDESGEPIVVAAKAMGFPPDVLQRIILFLNARVGQSVNRVYELVDLFHEISADAAVRLVTIFREANPVDEQKSQQDRLTWQTAAEGARRALSEMSRASIPDRAARIRPAAIDADRKAVRR